MENKQELKQEPEVLVKAFDDATNVQLRKLYLESLSRPVSYDNGQTVRPRVRHYEMWAAIPPFGRHGWSHTKGVYANHKQTRDLTQGDTWIWSDLHFGHKNIIRFSDRPFIDIPSMDEGLIRAFNAVVKPEDASIWVGDVAFYPDDRANAILHRLNGYKILVIGNHDFNKRKLKNLHFDEIHIVYNMKVNNNVVAFTHYPMDNVPNGWFNVHGHVHNSKPDVCASSNRHINVNCEFIDYKPMNLKDLVKQIAELSKQPVTQVKINYDEYD